MVCAEILHQSAYEACIESSSLLVDAPSGPSTPYNREKLSIIRGRAQEIAKGPEPRTRTWRIQPAVSPHAVVYIDCVTAVHTPVDWQAPAE